LYIDSIIFSMQQDLQDGRVESKEEVYMIEDMSKKVIVISAALVFLAFVLMIVSLGYEAIKSRRMVEEARKIEVKPQAVQPAPKRDFSAYKTIRGADGREMVLIPAGPFIMGGGDGAEFDEMPQHNVYVSAFYMDKYEVTNEDYQRFIRGTQYHPQTIPFFQDDVTLLFGPKQPAVGVSWDDAATYCKWVEKRLPTEAEWEKAARGEDGRTWPWGNSFGSGNANILGDEDGYKYTSPVGSFESGRSPYGLYDMAGNAAEWVADWYHQTSYKSSAFKNPKGPETGRVRVYRGGSWNDAATGVRAAKRYTAAEHRTDAILGFRCAKDGPPSAP
jgi:formylglycine-generating enzyme required for sulfatase activity